MAQQSDWTLGTEEPCWELKAVYECELIPESRTHIIPRAEVPRPMSKKPEEGANYWIISCSVDGTFYSGCTYWRNGTSDRNRFHHGNCFASAADCQANIDAMTAREE